MLISLVQAASAQEGKLSGRVSDANGVPAPYAIVSLIRDGEVVNGANADEQGKYDIQPIDPGTYDVKAEVLEASITITGVVINSNQTQFLDITLAKATNVVGDTNVIVAFKIPIFTKDAFQAKTVSGKDVRNMGSRNINIVAATTPGVYSGDEGDFSLNFRGARDGSTVYIVDGVKVRGSPNLPQSAIGEMQIITGGTPAEYGDFTGGAVSITTSRPASKVSGGGELVTSELLDAYGTNIVGVNLSGPLWRKEVRTNPEDANTAYKKTIMGFFASGEYNAQRDNDPAYKGIYKLSSDKLNDLQSNPVEYNPTLTTFVNRANNLTNDDLIATKAKANNQNLSVRALARLDISPNDNISLKIGGSVEHNNSNNQSWDLRNMLLAPTGASARYNADSYRTWARFQQSFKSDEKALVQNFFYTIQADYSLFKRTFDNPELKGKLWDYGYYGKFNYDRVPFYQYVADPVGSQYSSGPYWETIGYGYSNLAFDRTGTTNPVLSNVNDYIFNYVANQGIQIPGTGFVVNDLGDPNNVTGFNGYLNGAGSRQIYSLFNGLGNQYGSYRNRNQQQIRLTGQATAQIKNHNFKFGFEFEQRVERDYTLGARGLWTFARLYANRQLQGLDKNNATPIIRDGEFQDTVMLPVAYDPKLQTRLDKAIREDLGMAMNGTNWINTDALTPEFFNAKPLDHWFTFNDLANNGQGVLGNYYGYKYNGDVMKRANPEAFFTDTINRPQNAFTPTYISAFIQDKFELKDIVFNLGLRIDRFDANQYVLKDNYSLRETYSAGEAASLLNKGLPGGISSDWVPYVNDIKNPTDFVGFRNGEIWYDKNGAPASSSQIAQASGGQAKPYVKGDPTKLTFGAFKDYVPKVLALPRLSFSFPIAENALFFAHYDVLAQRPGQLRSNEASLLATQFSQYLFLPTDPTTQVTNPNLKPEVTVDYEAGFRQKIGMNSAISLAAYYREMRNMVQYRRFNNAYPITYNSYDNIDFGTVKGFSFSYDMRRLKQLQLNASYTLQFATATGSSFSSSRGVTDNLQGVALLRTLLPVNYDQRHRITASLDYRFGDEAQAPTKGPAVRIGKKTFYPFADAGVNFTAILGSGTPFSRQLAVTSILDGQQANGQTLGTPNSNRLPWNFRTDLRIDKSFTIKGKKEGAKPYGINVNLNVLNLLNTMNIAGIYAFTGLPFDDGFLQSPQGAQTIQSQINSTSFVDLYRARLNNPDNVTMPRRIRLGVNFNF